MSKLFLLSLVMLSSCALTNAQQKSQDTVLAIKAARMLDVRSGQLIDHPVILVLENRIKAVGSGLDIPRGARVLDLGDVTLMPGLIDAHTHLLHQYYQRYGDDDANRMREMVHLQREERLALGRTLARGMLEAGFTSVRDLGNSGTNIDVALRNAIDRGEVIGPRMFVSTRAISPVGGQFQSPTPEDLKRIEQEYVQVSNADEARQAVRQAKLDGADEIKVIVNAGGRRLTLEELKAIVEEAGRAHLPVAAHATDGDGPASMAVEAGVRSIEHGYTISSTVLDSMARKHIFLVPTDAANVPKYQERIRRALTSGVTIAIGSDMYYEVEGKTRGQACAGMYKSYLASGMSANQVLRAATINPAELIGNRSIGLLEPGRFADIIAVKGDPLEDLGVLEQVVFVMKDGREIKRL